MPSSDNCNSRNHYAPHPRTSDQVVPFHVLCIAGYGAGSEYSCTIEDVYYPARVVTLTNTDMVQPCFMLESSNAFFAEAGKPYTIEGYYTLKSTTKLGDGNHAYIMGEAAGNTVTDTDSWTKFSFTLDNTQWLTKSGFWNQAGTMQLADMVIKDGTGEIVYEFAKDADVKLGAQDKSSTTGKGNMWYTWGYGAGSEYSCTIEDVYYELRG